MSRYHRISKLATGPEDVLCPECGDDIQVWPAESEIECMGCGLEFSVSRDGGVSLEPLDEPDGWSPPPTLYHGTSLERFRNMLASPRAAELYLADSEDGTEMYATNAAEMDDSAPVVIAFDTGKLEKSGKLMPDWDDVNTMISNGETSEDGAPLFGDARSADEVPWWESLRLIGTCSYEGDTSGCITEVSVDGKPVNPPWEGMG